MQQLWSLRMPWSLPAVLGCCCRSPQIFRSRGKKGGVGCGWVVVLITALLISYRIRKKAHNLNNIGAVVKRHQMKQNQNNFKTSFKLWETLETISFNFFAMGNSETCTQLSIWKASLFQTSLYWRACPLPSQLHTFLRATITHSIQWCHS